MYTLAHLPPPKSAATSEICRNYNENRCRYSRCRYIHLCLGCAGQHPALQCPRRLSPSVKPPAGRPAHQGAGLPSPTHIEQPPRQVPPELARDYSAPKRCQAAPDCIANRQSVLCCVLRPLLYKQPSCVCITRTYVCHTRS